MKFLLPFLLFLVSAAAAQDGSFRDIDGGWHEAVVVTRNAEKMAQFFQTVGGWNKIDQGSLSKDTISYLTGGDFAATGKYVVVKSPDFEQGWVRIIELNGVQQEIIRSNAQPWDTGGIFSIMTRSSDVEHNLQGAENAGWTAFNDPYDFGFGNLKLRNIVLRGPDSVNLAIYEWVAPKREDAPLRGAVSKAFNSMQMVSDIERSKAFYKDKLGFEELQAGSFLDPEDRATNFALPVNYATKIPRDYAILIPKGADTAAGRVELMQFRGFEGRDLSGRSSLSNFGIVTLFFPVSDVTAKEKELTDNGVPFFRTRQRISLPPFGDANAFTVVSPEGALLTFFEHTD